MGRSAAHVRTRSLAVVAFAVLAALYFDFAGALLPPARAQDDKAAEEKKEAAPATVLKKEEGWLKRTGELTWHIITSAGCFFGPLLGFVSVILLALIVLLLLDLRMSAAIPPGFVEDFTDTVNKRKFKEAYDMAKEDHSYLGRVLTAGMSRLQYGIEDAREAAFNMVDSIRAGKEQPIVYLATIASLGPLLGLVGTVFGMIGAFMKLSKDGNTNVQGIAGDISHALVITLLGVGLAVPSIFCHAMFRNRLTKIALETGNVADDLLTQMYHNSKKPAPAVVPTVQAAEAVPTVDSRAVASAVKQK